jgi:membrane-associated phospholipid phosphatase
VPKVVIVPFMVPVYIRDMERQKAMRNFIVIWASASIVLAVVVLSTDKMALHHLMHPHNSPLADAFFGLITHVADGFVPTAIALVLLFQRKLRSFLMLGSSCVASALITQFLKQVVFATSDRPFMFKDKLGDLHWVEGLELHHHFSFPSGHATAAFSMCCALSVILARSSGGFILAILAFLLAYSRVYLSQHFTEDILAGAAIGTLTAYAVYRWLYISPFSRRNWLSNEPGYLK